MIIKGEKPPIYNFKMDGIEGEDGTTTTVMSDGSSLIQGEDIETTVGIFMAWDKTTMLNYIELLSIEYGEYLNVPNMAGQFVR